MEFILKRLLELINEFSKVEGQIIFTTATPNYKIIRINMINNVQGPYIKTVKHSKRNFKSHK